MMDMFDDQCSHSKSVFENSKKSSMELYLGQRKKETNKKNFSIKSLLNLKEDVQNGNERHKNNKTFLKRNCAGTNKRIRTIFTAEQLQKLEACFQQQQYMVRNERTKLAESLGLAEPQVKIWFQNRRIKWRKIQHENNLHKIREQNAELFQQASTFGFVNKIEGNSSSSSTIIQQRQTFGNAYI